MSNIQVLCNNDFYGGCNSCLSDIGTGVCLGCQRILVVFHAGATFHVGQIIYFNRKSDSFLEKGIIAKINSNDEQEKIITVRYFDLAFR